MYHIYSKLPIQKEENIMILENSCLHVEIAEHGAELMSIRRLTDHSELLWNADPAFWKRRSPILFPYVGKNWQGKVLINGETYATSAHGFARDRDFICESFDDTSAVFLLVSDEETKKMYPFDFELRITYRLNGSTLCVEWDVKNTSDCELFFTIGGHPAFCFADSADKKSDYRLKFSLLGGKDELCCSLLDLATGTIIDQFETVALNDGWLSLSEDLFSGDTLVMDEGQVRSVGLYHKNGTHHVTVRCEGFPNFGVWSMPNAPFVCLEPWMGRCDNYGFDKELSEKPNVNRLSPGEIFHAAYTIEA